MLLSSEEADHRYATLNMWLPRLPWNHGHSRQKGEGRNMWENMCEGYFGGGPVIFTHKTLIPIIHFAKPSVKESEKHSQSIAQKDKDISFRTWILEGT